MNLLFNKSKSTLSDKKIKNQAKRTLQLDEPD